MNAMPSYKRREQQNRDRSAEDYEAYYRRTKGALFDSREEQLFARLAGRRTFKRAVDLGSGTGRITEAIAPKCRHVVAADLSPVSLQVLAAKGLPSVDAVCADVASLPFVDGAFDLAISCQALHHLRFDDMLRALLEARRVLATGSRFVLSVYNLAYWRYRGIQELGEVDGTYYKRYTEATLRHLARTTGWDVAAIVYYKALPFRLLSSERWLAVDRILGSIPFIRRFLNAYMAVVLQRGD